MNERPSTIIIEPHVKGLIFDLDGTLADTMPLHFEAWHETLALMGLRCPQEFLEHYKGVPTDRIVLEINRCFGYDIDARQFCAEKQRRFRTKLPRAEPIPEIVAVVHRYREHLPMAVATGGTRTNVDLTLEAIDLQGCFAAVLTADDPVKPKPAPDIFLEAARVMHLEPRHCQVFEDGDLGLEAARGAGMSTLDVRTVVN